jgi:lipopolysaccharide transport system permease protein
VHRLVLRNLSGQFRQSFLGYLWIVLPPVVTTIVFSLLRRAQIMDIGIPPGGLPYELQVLVGTTFWGFFTQVVIAAATSIASAGNLVSKVYFPREVLVVSAVGQSLVNLAIRLGLVVVACALSGYLPSWSALGLPLLALPLLALGLGIGALLAPVNAVMNDTSRLLEFAAQFGLFLVPAVYATPVPAAGGGGLQEALFWLHTCNPVSHVLYTAYDWMAAPAVTHPIGLLLTTGASLLALALGWRFLHICEPLLAERL